MTRYEDDNLGGEMEMDAPEIPAIGDPEFMDALISLVKAARFMRGLILLAAEGEQSLIEVLQEHEEVARLSDLVINRWSEHLNVPGDDDSGMVN